MSEKNQPIHKETSGTLSVTMWENQGNKGKFLSAVINRSYENPQKKGEWLNTNSYRVNDLPTVTMLIQKCYEWAKTNKAELITQKTEA